MTNPHRFVAHTNYISVGPGTYFQIQTQDAADRPRPYECPQHDRPYVSPFAVRPPPDMLAGAILLLDGHPVPVLWAERSRAIVEIRGRTWLMSHMTPAEMALHRNSYELGSLVQEWIVREEVDLGTVGTA